METPETDTPQQLGLAVRAAMLWNTAGMVVTQVGLAAIFIVLASRLDPHIFGIFALAAVFIDFFHVQGTTSAIDAVVQRQDYSKSALSTVFWVMLTVIGGAVAVIALASGTIAAALKEPDLAPVLIALVFTLLPVPFVVAPIAVMRQKLDFKGIALRGIIASIAGGVCALAVAFSPWAEWALVAQRSVQVILSAVFVMLHTRIFPSLTFDKTFARRFFTATTRIFGAQGISGSIPRIVDLLVGIFFGVVLLGCLRVATKLLDVLFSALVNPIAGLWVVLVSKAGDNMKQRNAIFVQLTQLTALICLPGLLGVALTSKELTMIMLEPQYMPVANMLLVLCAFGFFIPLTQFRNGLLISLDKLNMLMLFTIADLVVVTGAILAMRNMSVEWVLVGYGLQNATSLAFAFPFLLKQMATSLRELLTAVLPPYAAAGLMIASVTAFDLLGPALDPWPSLIVKASLGGAVYIGFLFVFFRSWSIRVLSALRQRQVVPGPA